MLMLLLCFYAFMYCAKATPQASHNAVKNVITMMSLNVFTVFSFHS